jgi:uncharacterized protein (TIGR00725 family)
VTIDPVCGALVEERHAAATAFFAGRIYYFCSEEHRRQFEQDPATFAGRVSSGPLKVGVMGSASGDISPTVSEAAFLLGAAAAEKGLVVVTGAAPGLPWESARGAQSRGGLSVGISPALSLDEHLNFYQSPADVFDVIIYTGSGLMGREIVNIRSSDMVVIVGGHSGTLGEFAIAYDEGKLIGVLEGSGGIAEIVPQLVEAIDKETGAVIIYDTDPQRLVDRLVDEFVCFHFQRPSVFVRNNERRERPGEG